MNRIHSESAVREFRVLRLVSALFAVLIFGRPLEAGCQTSGAPFKNPVVARGQDPWVIRWKENYFLCQSRPGGIWVNRSPRLEAIGTNQWKCVWTAPAGTHYSREIWAPEMHFLEGRWYIFFAADDGHNTDHRMYVLEGDTEDPQAPFAFKGKIAAPTDRWAIDGTVLEMPDGKLYFIWSGWPEATDGAQNLYIAPMSNPWTISGERVCISQPDHEWERRDFPKINEGPEALWHDGHLFIIYSASAFWDENYCLGQLTWTGGEVMSRRSWLKKQQPVFVHTDKVSGPGHCSFVKSPDGREDWIIYHAHTAKGKRERDIRIQPFTWNTDGSPNFGDPISPGSNLLPPSGEY